jgi:putrescine transport system permease protein
MSPASRQTLALLLPWAWLLLFLLLPLLIVLAISFAQPVDGIPPFGWEGGLPDPADYATLVQDSYYLSALLRSLEIATLSSLFCLLLGYPMALAIASSPPSRRSWLLLLVILPFWTGFLLRITAWIGLLKDDGIINECLLLLGLIHAPLKLLYTDWALYLGMVYGYLPFMVLPLYARLSKRDPALEEAAADLGAAPWRVFWRVTFPLSLPGVVAGLLLVFIPTSGEYVIPELLGGPSAQTIGRVVWTEFFDNHDWPMASTVAIALIALLVPAAVLQWRRGDT